MTTIDAQSSAPLRDRSALRAVHAAVLSDSTDAVAPPPPPRIDPFLTVVKNRSARDVNPGLWEWQAEALDAWHAADCRGVIEAVTGAGKTMLGLTALFEALRLGVKTLVLVPTAELQNQWLSRIHDTVPEAVVGTLGNGRHDSLTECDVVIAIINSAARHDLLEDHQSGLLIADECHRYAAPTFVKALSDRFAYRLGLTATYTRPDHAEESRLDPYFGGVMYRLWYDRALSDGVIAPFDIVLVGIPLSPEERSDYDNFTSIMSKVSRGLRVRLNLTEAPLDQFMRAAQRLAGRRNDQSPECIMARRYLDAVSRRLALLANAQEKLNLLGHLTRVIERSAGTLVFAETIDTSTRAGETLTQHGHVVDVVSSASNASERRGALQRFAAGYSGVLCAPRILDEGIDVPEADLAIVISGTRQKRQSIQRLGRVIRRKKDGGKGRFVFVYAADTVEDPVAGKRDPLEDILPFADRTDTFSHLQTRELVQFLLPTEDDVRGVAHVVGEPDPSAGTPLVIDEHSATQDPASGGSSRREAPTPQPGMPHEDCGSSSGSIVLRMNPTEEEDADSPPEFLGDVAFSPDPVKQYLREIGATQLLTAEEEVELAQRIEVGLYAQHVWGQGQFTSRRERHDLEGLIREGKEAYDHFARANLRLVVNIAAKYKAFAKKLDFLDLIQEGNLGLARAIQKFDYTKGMKFSTYATWWIRQHITRSMADDDRTVRVPVHVVEQITGHRKCEQDVTCDHNLALVTSAERVQPRSLDQMLDADRYIGYFDGRISIVDSHTANSDFVVVHPEETLLQSDMRSLVNTAIDESLDERSADIIRRRHGWFGEGETLDAIGKTHGVTRERIRQLEKLAVGALTPVLQPIAHG